MTGQNVAGFTMLQSR